MPLFRFAPITISSVSIVFPVLATLLILVLLFATISLGFNGFAQP
jgi:hypothetical protein